MGYHTFYMKDDVEKRINSVPKGEKSATVDKALRKLWGIWKD